MPLHVRDATGLESSTEVSLDSLCCRANVVIRGLKKRHGFYCVVNLQNPITRRMWKILRRSSYLGLVPDDGGARREVWGRRNAGVKESAKPVGDE